MSKREHIFFLLGPETGLKEEYLHTLKQDLTKAYGAIEEEHLYAFEDSFSDALPRLQNASLFGEHTLLLIHNAERLSTQDQNLLALYAQTPSPSSTLVILSDEIRLPQRLEKLASHHTREVFWELREDQKARMIHQTLKRSGRSIASEAVDLFLQMVSPVSSALVEEASRLAFFFPEGHTITEKDIEQFLFHSREENVFTLFAHLARRDIEAALECTSALLSQSEAVHQIIGGLLWQFRRLLTVMRLLGERYGREEAFREAGIRGMGFKRTMETALRNYTLEETQRAIVELVSCDEQVRLHRRELHPLIFTLALHRIVRHPRAARPA
ncbi:DNA polymerase III subunit delta [Spirochaeta thermophila]|uniref:DNA-directed DNA polymerase n=1 Tax=Winmispira thermophila (strain ATCC 49972 / DSM 6192 / RI 19.B1) TaxID=665571 RepID=E0RRM6_WINT6|nr:DNA polymerase III subunit delta [Spirochaeta thermophila]ADN03130.1 hypothetical protein STHERM_c22020 [Spirochaeta thermophila DSM 6192]